MRWPLVCGRGESLVNRLGNARSVQIIGFSRLAAETPPNIYSKPGALQRLWSEAPNDQSMVSIEAQGRYVISSGDVVTAEGSKSWRLGWLSSLCEDGGAVDLKI